MICSYCKNEIKPGEKQYISKQAGMEGTYHWSCFVDACKKTKKHTDDYTDPTFFGGDIDAPFIGTGNSSSN